MQVAFAHSCPGPDDPAGDRHAEAGQNVDDLAADSCSNFLRWQGLSAEAPLCRHPVPSHDDLARGVAAVVDRLLPAALLETSSSQPGWNSCRRLHGKSMLFGPCRGFRFSCTGRTRPPPAPPPVCGRAGHRLLTAGRAVRPSHAARDRTAHERARWPPPRGLGGTATVAPPAPRSAPPAASTASIRTAHRPPKRRVHLRLAASIQLPGLSCTLDFAWAPLRPRSTRWHRPTKPNS